MPANRKRLDAVLQRRDDGEPPWPWDNEILLEYGETPNPNMPLPAATLRPGKGSARVLHTLRDGCFRAEKLAEELGESTQYVRNAINQLRRYGYRIENDWIGRFRLVEPK